MYSDSIRQQFNLPRTVGDAFDALVDGAWSLVAWTWTKRGTPLSAWSLRPSEPDVDPRGSSSVGTQEFWYSGKVSQRPTTFTVSYRPYRGISRVDPPILKQPISPLQPRHTDPDTSKQKREAMAARLDYSRFDSIGDSESEEPLAFGRGFKGFARLFEARVWKVQGWSMHAYVQQTPSLTGLRKTCTERSNRADFAPTNPGI